VSFGRMWKTPAETSRSNECCAFTTGFVGNKGGPKNLDKTVATLLTPPRTISFQTKFSRPLLQLRLNSSIDSYVYMFGRPCYEYHNDDIKTTPIDHLRLDFLKLPKFFI